MTKSEKSALSEPQNASAADMEDQIRRRAYQIYEARGSEHGRDMQDWLEAEQELQTKAKSAAA